jgi:O-acetyl-ADP-ribose deacetylase (regulator of RNase III)
MVQFTKGDILSAEAEALVNTVNCVGVMGRGIALQFKKAFPENFKAYVSACKCEQVQPGHMFVYETGEVTNPRFIINFPTKRHWKGKSRMEDVVAGIASLVEDVMRLKIKSIAIPPLGCGLGGLDWTEVRPKIEQAFAPLNDVSVYVFEPDGAPSSDKMVHNKEVPDMTVGRAALVGLMDRYLKGLLDPFVTLLEVHKLMYFMQEVAGQPLRLHFVKAHFGPYAENLGHVLNLVEGHFISGYADGGDAPEKQLQLVPSAIQDASELLKSSPETLERFEKVSRLVEGFESPFGLELLATVHWVVTHQNSNNLESVIKGVYSWNSHKKQFSERQIKLAVEQLVKCGCINPFLPAA